ncbi:MAG: hypothetical protein PHO37_11825 [Kiritimatiellae bacterium]|nr:hypothetical protein [Kiritimatiellia bacterium]
MSCTSLKEFPTCSEARAVTGGEKDHLFASYYAINSWSADSRYISVLQTDIKDRLPLATDPAVLGIVDLKDNNRFIPLVETRCWNFQEGTMAHWLGFDPNRKLIYNDLAEGKFVSVVIDIQTREKRVIPYPVSAVTRDGQRAVSINYARLNATRPDYGYDGNGQDPLLDTTWPKDDGLFLVDLESGKGKLIVSIDSVREQMPEVKDPQGLAYFCHTVFSRDGKQVFWLARSVENLGEQKQRVAKWQTTAFACNIDGTNLRRCFPDGWGGSHFNWVDGERMVVTAKFKDKVYSHVLFTPGKDDHRRVSEGLLDFDGHCVVSNDGNWMLTDTYPNKLSQRNLMLVRMRDEAVLPLGGYDVVDPYTGTYWRCDLHPRWRNDDQAFGFNSVHNGSRQVYIIDVK